MGHQKRKKLGKSFWLYYPHNPCSFHFHYNPSITLMGIEAREIILTLMLRQNATPTFLEELGATMLVPGIHFIEAIPKMRGYVWVPCTSGMIIASFSLHTSKNENSPRLYKDTILRVITWRVSGT